MGRPKQLTASEHLAIAKKHLERVQAAWDDETDWADLFLYGFYCLESAVMAAAMYKNLPATTRHGDKVNLAKELSTLHGLSDVSDLLINLNQGRKAVAYGDVDEPEYDAEDLANDIDNYVEEVERFLQT